MPCALAFAATAAPDSLLIDAMTSTLTPLEIMPSASVENFCSSPWAFWMSASRPSACIAAVSSGLSKPSHRAELCVSGRITPTLMPPAAGAAALGALPPLLGAAAFCPQAASAIVRPSPAASTAVRLTAVVLVRIRRPFPLRWGPRRGNVVSGNVCGPTSVVPTTLNRSSRRDRITIRSRGPGFVVHGSRTAGRDASAGRPSSGSADRVILTTGRRPVSHRRRSPGPHPEVDQRGPCDDCDEHHVDPTPGSGGCAGHPHGR